MSETTYHCRNNICWKVETLWKLSKDLQPFNRDLSLFEKDLDKDPWFSYKDEELNLIVKIPKLKLIVAECKRAMESDLNYPIILCPDYLIMDGFHRLLKCHLLNLTSIKCVRFETLPKPD